MKKSNHIQVTQSVSSTLVPHSTRVEETLQTPASLLPAQFFTPSHESHINWTGERLLMLAVLQEAVLSYYRHASAKTHRGKRLFAETCSWFWNQEREYLYSFESICLHLQLEPDYVRRGLRHCPQSPDTHLQVPRASQRRRISSGSNLMTLAA